MPKHSTPRWFKILFVLMVGLPVTLGTFNYINLAQLKRNKKLAQQAHQEVEKKLQEELKKISLAINSIHVLFSETDTITRPTFNAFTKPFLRNLPGIKALEWLPKLPLEARAAHEAGVRAEGFENYSIKTANLQLGKMIIAPEKAFYYPVHYIVPEKWNEITLGFDLSSNPLRLRPLLYSEQFDSCIVSRPLQLIQNKDYERSFLVLQAVKKQDSIQGVVQGIYKMNSFIDTILHEQLRHLQVNIYDTTQDTIPAYQSEALDSLRPFDAALLADYWTGPIQLSLGNRQWKVYTRPREHLTAYPHRPIAYTALAIGVMIMLIIIVILRLNDHHAQRLRQEVTERTLQLSEANRAQAVLLKEIHHRVKNNLQVITGLLSLQALGIEDEATKELFRVCQYRIAAMGMLHEQLYQSENLSRLSYGLYLEKLVGQLLSSIKGKNHNIEVDLQVENDLYLQLDTAIPLGLLINELFTNSLKYGFPDQEVGHIYIHLQQLTDGNYLLLMGDNGVGFSEQQVPRKSTSLGLQLVRQLVRQLSGTYQRVEKGAGTHYKILFQESE